MKITTLGLLILMLSSFNSYAGYEVIKIKLLNMTIPAEIDDHGKFGLATPDFELVFRLKCGGGLFTRSYTVDSTYFSLESNPTKKSIKRKIDGVELEIKPNSYKACLRDGSPQLQIEEVELIGTDNYLRLGLREILFEREYVDSPFKMNSTVIKTMKDGDGEADWSVVGIGPYRYFLAQVEFKSVWIEE